jgi:hypothetical protein
MNTAIIIMCAGEGKRWEKDYPKHMAIVEGVPNVVRTHNMVIANGVSEKNIFLTVNEQNKDYFPSNFNLILGNSSREIDRFRNAFTLMKDYERTIFLYGDAIYHYRDMKQILSLNYNPKLDLSNKNNKRNCYVFFGRTSGNPVTNKPYRELYALSIIAKEIFMDDVNKVALDFEAGKIKTEIGWQVYESLYHKKYKTFTELSYYTEDYDTLLQYEHITKCLFG